jgi:outer membrane protein assembly factor BamB
MTGELGSSLETPESCSQNFALQHDLVRRERRMRRPAVNVPRSSLVVGIVSFVLSAAGPARAASDSLWIGTDNTADRSVLNTDRAGTLLDSVGPVEATGFAIDQSANVIYFGTSDGSITPRDLTTLTAGTSFSAGGSEDMTFDGTFIWRCGAAGPDASSTITEIDPATHVASVGFTVPFQALGIAWDGSGFWIGEFGRNGLIQRFDRTGNPTGESFHTSGDFVNGGLAFDNTDNTLYIGTFNQIFHYSTAGTELGSFTVPTGDGRFVDGLEFEPEPTIFAELWAGVLGLLTLKSLRARRTRS